ncbi:hypothetical protein DID88_006459 [Monilinia fructigena]|uniref:Glycoside hydrolase family 5 domain-containing protein n=1 Tax=Monilinia fructigena TaxID=38457 RepID=A0A395IHB5_9HELO|nr:hypothetical protein DID88_006459 [Monilinia fructigena]
MHTVPGAQNPDWHSDNPSNHASFWDHKDHQDRTTIWLWSQIATRYRNNPWIAGYNPINEPCDPLHHRLPEFYTRFESSIRKIDPFHILWLDGNTFAMEWKSFSAVLPNCAYALHDYSSMGFPTGTLFTSTPSQIEKLESSFLRKCTFMKTHNVPSWNGEFGPVYADPTIDQNAEETNTQRYNLLGAQLKIYDKHQIPWSIWLYKDLGLQGMVTTSRSSPYHTLIAPFLEKEARAPTRRVGFPNFGIVGQSFGSIGTLDRRKCPQGKRAVSNTMGCSQTTFKRSGADVCSE